VKEGPDYGLLKGVDFAGLLVSMLLLLVVLSVDYASGIGVVNWKPKQWTLSRPRNSGEDGQYYVSKG
jgi:hypothetical protein